MPYINLPPALQTIFSKIDDRLTRLELAQRYTAPNVNFASNLPSNPRVGDTFYDTNANVLKYWNGVEWMGVANYKNTAYTTPHSGDFWYDTSVGILKYYNGTAWIQVADDLYGTSITALPTTMQTVNNNMVYTGNPVTIEVQRIGKMITANAIIEFTNVTNFGTGQYYFDIPAGIPTRAHDLAAGGFATVAGVTYTVFGTLAETANKMYLWLPTANGGSDVVTHNKPTTFTTTSVINITGVALLA